MNRMRSFCSGCQNLAIYCLRSAALLHSHSFSTILAVDLQFCAWAEIIEASEKNCVFIIIIIIIVVVIIIIVIIIISCIYRRNISCSCFR